MIRYILLVALGGGSGSALRYICQRWIDIKFPALFPFGTFAVNITGCLIAGFLFGLSEKNNMLTTEMRLLLMTGFCGGFTTFSAFASENFRLIQNGHTATFILYTLLSILTGVFAAWGGYIIARTF